MTGGSTVVHGASGERRCIPDPLPERQFRGVSFGSKKGLRRAATHRERARWDWLKPTVLRERGEKFSVARAPRAPPFRAKRRESAARGRADSNDRWLQRAALQRSAAVWGSRAKKEPKKAYRDFQAIRLKGVVQGQSRQALMSWRLNHDTSLDVIGKSVAGADARAVVNVHAHRGPPNGTSLFVVGGLHLFARL